MRTPTPIEELIEESFRNALLRGTPWFILMHPETFEKFRAEFKPLKEIVFNGGKITYGTPNDIGQGTIYNEDDPEFPGHANNLFNTVALEIVVSAYIDNRTGVHVVCGPGEEYMHWKKQ